jgi:DNA-binding transcriptional ArsR family regulator
MEVPQNTMSAHLAVLAHGGLVKGERQSRSIIYRANLARFREVALPAQGLLRRSSRYMRAHNRRSHAAGRDFWLFLWITRV